MMTRKHFKEMATILFINGADPILVRDLADMCGRENPRFNRSKFYEVVFKED